MNRHITEQDAIAQDSNHIAATALYLKMPTAEEINAYQKPLTDIDRQGCKRTVPLEVICPAYCKPSSPRVANFHPSSPRKALKRGLETLGYHNVYHGAEALFENTIDMVMWNEAIRAKYDLVGKPYGREEWDQLLGHCMATTDWPSCMFAPELITAIPDAKVVLSVRDVDVWYKSVCSTVFDRTGNNWLWFVRQFEWHLRISANTTRLGFNHFFGTRDWYKAAKRRYQEHNAMVKGLVPPERLLVWQPSDGREPLCAFLEKPVPEGPFPRGNQSDVFFARIMKYTQERMTIAYRRLAVCATLLVMLLAWAVGEFARRWSYW